MEVTRDVVLDLLPLYLADEVSADTRTLVEEYLETDPELAKIAEQSAGMELAEDIPIPLAKEDRMEAYREARRIMLLRTVILAIVISLVLLALVALVTLAVFFLGSS
jgi:anti-sigma factor RsiW